MSHHHNEHHHSHHGSGELPFAEKASKLLEHWRKHNEDHAATYRHWADEFRHHQHPKAAVLLESAAELTRQINLLFEQAAEMIPK